MDTATIVRQIEEQIARLEEAKLLLIESQAPSPKRRGRPRKQEPHLKTSNKVHLSRKRKISPEGRERIAAAQKARWATRKKNVKAA